nr:unnamed protein product [Callosobruchus analis]
MHCNVRGISFEEASKRKKIVRELLRPLTIVCDQSSVNQKLYRSLKITPENPHFYIDDVRYYAISDAPHLIKSIRNNLLTGDFILNDEIISWRYIKQLYTIDKQSETARAMPKITDLHIPPNNVQKMRVRLAAQKPYCCGCNVNSSRYRKTINAIKLLHSDNKTKDLPYLLTGRLNQDASENTFLTYRQRGGYNKNPTARTFSSLFKSNSVSGLLKPPNDSNCELDEDIDLFVQSARTMLVPEEDTWPRSCWRNLNAIVAVKILLEKKC